MLDLIIDRLLSIPGMILFFSFRGFFQAWVAKKLGDHLPERDGFLTMNPKAHINIFGFIMLLLVGIGFGKPMRFDSTFYKNKKRDTAIQILSGPAAGIIAGFAMYAVYFMVFLAGTPDFTQTIFLITSALYSYLELRLRCYLQYSICFLSRVSTATG